MAIIFDLSSVTVPGSAAGTRYKTLADIDLFGGGPYRIVFENIGVVNLNVFSRVLSGDEKASLTTTLSGDDNDLVYTARASGRNDMLVQYVVAGLNTPLSVFVASLEITVNVATDADGLPISTAAEIKAAIEAHAVATVLVSVALAPGNDGTGIVTAMNSTPLAGGAAEVEYQSDGPILAGASIQYLITAPVGQLRVDADTNNNAGDGEIAVTMIGPDGD